MVVMCDCAVATFHYMIALCTSTLLSAGKESGELLFIIIARKCGGN